MSLNMGTVQINRPIHTEHLHLHLRLQPHLKMGYTPNFAFAFAMSQTQTLSVNGPLGIGCDFGRRTGTRFLYPSVLPGVVLL